MLPPALIGLMFAAGAAAWVYSKTMYRTGGNTKSALTAAAVAGIIGFIIIVSLLSLIGDYLEG